MCRSSCVVLPSVCGCRGGLLAGGCGVAVLSGEAAGGAGGSGSSCSVMARHQAAAFCWAARAERVLRRCFRAADVSPPRTPKSSVSSSIASDKHSARTGHRPQISRASRARWPGPGKNTSTLMFRHSASSTQAGERWAMRSTWVPVSSGSMKYISGFPLGNDLSGNVVLMLLPDFRWWGLVARSGGRLPIWQLPRRRWCRFCSAA